MIEDPSLRIFHIDPECYIIYLGKGADDYRPFLRIGTSPSLSDRAKSFISAVVVTESLTGNQMLEHQNLQLPLNGETRYIGEPEEIGRLKRFLDEQDLPVEGYEYEEDEENPKKAGAFVYFYRGGNLHIVHDKKRIFNLRDRERDDGHFIHRAERVVRQVKENPLRFMPRDLGPPGFIFAGDRPYFFREGRLGCVDLPPDYIVDLGRYGVDPDLVQWLVEDHLSEGLLNRFKRAAVTRKELRVATSEPGSLQTAVSLFVGMGLSCVVVHLEPDREKTFSGFTLARRGRELRLGFPPSTGFPELLFSGGAGVPALFDKRGIRTLRSSEGGFSPVQGVPYRALEKDDREPAALAEDYLHGFLREFKDCGDPAVEEFARRIEPLCRAVAAPAGGAAAKVLHDARARDFSDPPPGGVTFFLWNIRELARLWSRRKGVAEGFRKHGARLAALAAPVPPPDSNETRLPILGDILRADGEWYVLYRLGGVLTPLKISQARKSSEAVDRLAAWHDEAFHLRERERLERFLQGLSVPPPRRKRKSSAPEGEPRSPVELLAETARSGESGGGDPTETQGTPAGEGGAGPGGEKAPQRADAAGGAPHPGRRGAASERGGPGGVPTGGASGGARSGVPGRQEGRRRRLGAAARVLPVLAVAAAGGAVFLLIRSCPATGPVPVTDRETTEASPSANGSAVSAIPAPVPGTGPGGEDPGSAGAVAAGRPGAADQAGAVNQAGAVDQAGAVNQAGAVDQTGAPPAGLPGLDPDSFSITVLDVFLLVNQVAVENGYRPLDRPVDVRPDPNWIFPASSFRLPDGGEHRVRQGDTLWGIATEYIRGDMRRQAGEFNRRMAPHYQGRLSREEKNRIAGEVRKMAEVCRSENMRRFLDDAASTLTKE